MSSCFNHKDVESVAICPYCAKAYCADCLLLHGPMDRIICINCYDVISTRANKSLNRRKWYIVAGVVFLVVAVPFLFLLASPENILLGLVIAGVIGASVLNIVRTRQYKEILVYRKYSAP